MSGSGQCPPGEQTNDGREHIWVTLEEKGLGSMNGGA